MAVLSRLIQAPAAVRIGPGVAAELPGILADQRISASGRLAVAISEGSGTQLREQLAGDLPADVGWFTVSRASLDAAVDLADRVRADKAPYDTLVAIGGGKVIDAAKYAAARLGMPLVAVATNLAHDGVCSPVATLENDAGTGSYGVPNPIGVVIDLDLIRQAPPRFVRSGIGEALSNLCALADWELSHRETGEPIDGLAAAMARTAAEAILHHPGTIDDAGFLGVLANGLVLSGQAMAVAGTSRPSSGACHEISHAIDQLFPKQAAQHGEQCGVGAVFATHLRGEHALAAEMAAVLTRHELPVTPGDLGLDIDQFADAVTYAPHTRPGRFTILEHLDLSRSRIDDAVKGYVATYAR
ncbi:iron-containing alcohol dehydrogenase family protein [Actinospica sp. MGRD01-02]|uniref:Iron-containing alcohol dehydrogenase family protein n=1 Tax=Actinospica acidithermotolerans TaxID=2828514 RepID=A0A941ED01_9ACTN|nr:iron-containing alcohol dehydrogenase family protein [Actinospica acidithermotolerans]MBR7828130.1 iron-containing alcohol dehydrogenase family protein [Actinospica acidithermotolerans]